MIKKVESFVTTDGKTFKTENGAKKHQKKLEHKDMLKKKGLTSQELQTRIELASNSNANLKLLLNTYENWEKFPPNLIDQIFEKWDTLFNPKKITKYVIVHNSWRGKTEEVIHTEEGENFADSNIINNQDNEWDSYVVKSEQEVNSNTKVVILEKKYSPGEISLLKIQAGVDLKSDEIREFMYENHLEHEEEGEDRRWSKSVLSVVRTEDGDLYAIEWDKGLTENQDNEFYNQPYKVKLEKIPVTVIQTKITPI